MNPASVKNMGRRDVPLEITKRQQERQRLEELVAFLQAATLLAFIVIGLIVRLVMLAR
jgi:hypothetical protein